MKNKLPIVLFLIILALFLLLSGLFGRSNKPDELAVANAYGRLSGFVFSSNYPAAYEAMSSDFRKTHAMPAFQARIEKSLAQSLRECDWTQGGTIGLKGTQATLSIKYGKDLGRTFYFVKEGGHWRFTGKVVDYNSSLQ